jgi:hypothetical protein
MILSDSFVSRLEGKLGIHQRPLKEQLAILTYRLRVQRNKIESMGLMLQHRDKELFDKCVAANTTGDTLRAGLYASECADIRKIVKLVHHLSVHHTLFFWSVLERRHLMRGLLVSDLRIRLYARFVSIVPKLNAGG